MHMDGTRWNAITEAIAVYRMTLMKVLSTKR